MPIRGFASVLRQPQLQDRGGRSPPGSVRGVRGERYDVAVVGAGPAGSAAALAARRAGAGCCCSTAPTSRATSRAATASPPHAFDVLRRPRACTGVDRRLPAGRPACGWSAPAARRSPGRWRGPRTPSRAGSSTPGWSPPPWRRGAELRRHTVRQLRRRAGPGRARRRVPARVRDRRGRRRLGRPPGARATGRTRPATSPSPSAATPRPHGPPSSSSSPRAPRWPAYAWSFPIGDGTANVGYGEVLRGAPLSRAYLLDRLAALLPGTPGPDRPARAPPAAVDPPAAARPRPGAAGRRRAVADQPVHRRGDLLRRAVRRAGRCGRRGRPGRASRPAVRRRAPPPARPAPAALRRRRRC